jgi:hypothetical protein
MRICWRSFAADALIGYGRPLRSVERPYLHAAINSRAGAYKSAWLTGVRFGPSVAGHADVPSTLARRDT